ncbi:MAG: MFS transporter, partial [Acidimicrobiales bacterium]
MASLDNLVVSTALPVIRIHLHAGLSGLEWTVNAYTLTFAVLLLSAAAVGERFGRRRIFVLGIAVFTVASAAAALAPNIGILIAARAVQGAGGAMIMPLSLTLLSAAVTPARRNAALGIWGAIGGTAVAFGPLVGGAVTTGWAWQYIFWLNVPIGVALVPLAWWKLRESHGAAARLDLAGVALVSAGLFGLVLGLVRGD